LAVAATAGAVQATSTPLTDTVHTSVAGPPSTDAMPFTDAVAMAA
jgi:hypothetical protein